MDTATATKVDLSEKQCFPVGWGLVYCVWCAPKEWTAEQISNDVSGRDPPGTSNNLWVVSDDESCANHKQWGQETNRKPCPYDENRIHVLMNC